MRDRVRITEVSPRDGLQNEPGIIPTTEKVRLVDLLTQTGVDEIEISSFVSAKWIPQLGDAEDVFRQCQKPFAAAPLFSALVPNERGMQSVLEVNQRSGRRLIDKIALFTAASETFSKKNTNATIAQTFERFEPVVRLAKSAGLTIRGYVSCAIACPFEGAIDPTVAADVSLRLAKLGVDEVDLGDTIGAATPTTTKALVTSVQSLLADHPHRPRLTLHLHDTFGHAGECVKTALDLGVRSFDGSVAGLGGCPYASTPQKRAPGNISTELLVKTVHAAGYKTGVELDRLGEAAAFARSIVASARRSHGE